MIIREYDNAGLIINAAVHKGDPIAELEGIRAIVTEAAHKKLRLLERLIGSSYRPPRVWPDTHPHALWFEPISDTWQCVPCGRVWTSEEVVRDDLFWRRYRALIGYGVGQRVTNPDLTLKGATVLPFNFA